MTSQARRGRGETEADDATHCKTRNVRPDVGPFATKAEQDQKHDPACKWGPTAEPAAPRHHAGAPHVTREDAQRAKDAAWRGVCSRTDAP